MKNVPLLKIMSLAGFCLALTSHLSAEILDLYLSPTTESPAVAESEDSDPALDGAEPVGNPQLAEAGWHRVDFRSSFTGFVLAARLNEDGEVSPNTTLRTEDSTSAPVLTVIAEDDEILVVETEGPWRAVTVRKSLPLYFQAPAGWSPWPMAEAADEGEAKPSPTVSRPEAPAPSLPRVSRNYEGTLKETGKRYLLFGSPPYPYELRDADNNRIAYLDFSGLIIDRALERYIDKPIQVHGRLIKDSEKDVRVIRVQLLR